MYSKGQPSPQMSRISTCLTLLGLVAFAVLTASAAPALAQQEPTPALFTGWRTTHADLTVHINPEERKFIVDGQITLTLDAESAEGITLVVNTSRTAMEWVSAEVDGQACNLGLRIERFPAARPAELQFDEPKRQGDTVQLAFQVEFKNFANQVGLAPEIALASWTDAWYPFPLPRIDRGEEFTASLLSAPGKTTFHLPPGWSALCDGVLVSREANEEEVVEVRELGEAHVARSFSAAAYQHGQVERNGRQAAAYLLKEREQSVDDMAELFDQIITAQEEAFGPYPFTTVGVAEVIERIPGWYAASQQTFIMAKSSAFEHGHVNLPLWSHELCHAWWGNTVMTTGDAEKVVSESLAQFGAVLAIEALEGVEARNKFLEYSRSGYSPLQCARGYAYLLIQGKDHPLSDLSNSELDGGTTHSLADSKGMWFYHMLRLRVGDELMFSTLKKIVEDYRHRPLSLADLRARFIAAAPEHDLEPFFAQWLDRTGAPRLTSQVDAETRTVVVEQTQDGEPFRLDVDVKVNFADGSSEDHSVALSERTASLKLKSEKDVESIELDPDKKILLLRPEYKQAHD